MEFLIEILSSVFSNAFRFWLTLANLLIAQSFSVEAASAIGVISGIIPFFRMYAISIMQSVPYFVGMEMG